MVVMEVRAMKRNFIFAVAIWLLSTAAFGQTIPACPDPGNDPSKFCPVGQIWSETANDCVLMA